MSLRGNLNDLWPLLYVCIFFSIYIYIDINIYIYALGVAWLVPYSSVSVADFGQVNACWVLVILMTRFLLTNNIFDWFIYFAVIFCSIRLFFTVNITNFNNYLVFITKWQVFMVLWSVLRSPLVLGPRCVATSHCGLTGWFLHGAGFLLVGTLEQILVLEVLF